MVRRERRSEFTKDEPFNSLLLGRQPLHVERQRATSNGQAAFGNDMPYTPYTDTTLRRLAALEPRTLAVMHGSSFRGDGRVAILDLAGVIKEALSDE